jgi:hypothetical protein
MRDVVPRYVEGGDKLKTAKAAILRRVASELRGAASGMALFRR